MNIHPKYQPSIHDCLHFWQLVMCLRLVSPCFCLFVWFFFGCILECNLYQCTVGTHVAPPSSIFITIRQHAYLWKVQGYFRHPKRLLPTPEAMCCWGRTWHKALCFQYRSRGHCFLKRTWIICLSLFCHWLPSTEGLQNS